MAGRRIRLTPVIRFAVPGLPSRWQGFGLPILRQHRSVAPQDQTQQEQRLQSKKSHSRVTTVTTTTNHRISPRSNSSRLRIQNGGDSLCRSAKA